MYYYRFDYHFHPNIFLCTEKKAFQRISKIFTFFKKYKINTVLVCEHNYKRPKMAFEYMEKYNSYSDIYLIPGIEVLTAEGLHIIVYAKYKEELFVHPELLKPKALNLDDILQFIKKHRLYAIIAHPYILGKTGIIRKKGEQYFQKYLTDVGRVEGYNNSLYQLEKIFKFLKLNKFFKKVAQKFQYTAKLPENFLNNKEYFISGGSDAHQPEDIGSYMEIKTTTKIENYDQMFELFNKKNKGKFVKLTQKFNLLHFLKNGFIITTEAIIKNLKLYKIDEVLKK